MSNNKREACLSFPGSSSGKESQAKAGDVTDMDSIPGLGSSPGGRHGDPLHYSCLENPMDRGAWRPTAHSVTKSPTDWRNLARTQAGAYLTMFMQCKLLSLRIQKVIWSLSSFCKAPGGTRGSLPAGYWGVGTPTQVELFWTLPAAPVPMTGRKSLLFQKYFCVLLCNFVNFQMCCAQPKRIYF